MRRLKKLLVWLIWLLAVGATLGWAWLQGVFQVRQADCRQDNQPCQAPIQAVVDQLQGQPFLFVNLEQTINQALGAQYPYLSVKSVTNLGWGRLEVTLWQSSDRLLVVGPNGDQSVLDTAGRLAAVRADERLIQVELSPAIYDQLRAEHGLPEELARQLLTMALQIEAQQIKYQRLELKNEQLLLIVLPGQTQLICELARPELVPSLPLLIEELKKPEYANIKEVDLRYKLPVLRQENTI